MIIGMADDTFDLTETYLQLDDGPEAHRIAVDLILDEEGAERVVELRGRSGCVVPRGVWHRGVVHSPGDVLHITRGDGSQHRPV